MPEITNARFMTDVSLAWLEPTQKSAFEQHQKSVFFLCTAPIFDFWSIKIFLLLRVH